MGALFTFFLDMVSMLTGLVTLGSKQKREFKPGWKVYYGYENVLSGMERPEGSSQVSRQPKGHDKPGHTLQWCSLGRGCRSPCRRGACTC